jgi:hypothetical protein
MLLQLAIAPLSAEQHWEVGHAVIKGLVDRFGAVLREGETGRCSEGEHKEANGTRTSGKCETRHEKEF